MGAQKMGIAHRFCHQKVPKSDPAEFLVFEQVLKQRLRRDLPRGFILVPHENLPDSSGKVELLRFDFQW